MSRLSPEQVIQISKTQEIWKVHFREYVDGSCNDCWDFYYASYDEAYETYMKNKEDLPIDYYNDFYMFGATVAYKPEKVSVDDIQRIFLNSKDINVDEFFILDVDEDT